MNTRASVLKNRKGTRVGYGMLIGALAGAMLYLLLSILAPATSSVYAAPSAQAISGSVTHDSSADFLASCTTLSGTFPAPQLDRTTVSPVAGGELRLRPTLEDYFDAPQIDATLWISDYSNTAYPNVPPPQIVNGVVRLDANYLRAQQGFGAEMPVRFFEASARFVTAPDPVAYADIGFYRSMPPLRAVTETSSIRLFVAQTTIESFLTRHLFVRSKDGLFIPNVPPTQGALDTVVDNWGDNPAAQLAGLDQFHTYRIEWDQNVTDYLLDGSQIITAAGGASLPLPHAGISTLPTYAFLYSQDPSFFDGGRSPLLVDWVRAGAYPAQGAYTSCALDAGAIVNWSRATISASVPAGTALALESRTSQDGVAWSAWRSHTVVASGVIALENPGGRYFQYRVKPSTTDVTLTPEVTAIAVAYVGPKSLRVKPPTAFINPNSQLAFSAVVLDLNDEVIVDYPATITWSVVNASGAIDSNGLFTAGALTSRFTDTVLATSPGLQPGSASVNIGSVPNITAGACCFGPEGTPLTLTVSVNASVHEQPLDFAWDIDNDGVFGDLIGEKVLYTFPKTGEYPLGVRATNAQGFTNTLQLTATVTNVPPQIVAIESPGAVKPGEIVTVTVTAVDVPAAVLSYAFDWNNDGVFDTPDQAGNQASTVFPLPGEQTIRVRVRDDDDGATEGTTGVRVEPRQLFLPAITR